MPMKDHILRYGLSLVLTILLFCYGTWGDFSWVTLTGPISLEPNLENPEGPGYGASPALQAVITRLFFVLTCFFFSMIPNLAGGLRRHAGHLAGVCATVWLTSSYLLGSLTFFEPGRPGASTLRTASVLAVVVILSATYDHERKTFTIPGPILKPSFLAPLLCLFLAVCLANAVILQDVSRLFHAQPLFVILRLGTLVTALTGAAAFHAWKHGA